MATYTSAFATPRRAQWMTARARNAAKRGGLVAAIGVLAVVATLLTLILLPREVNRSVRARVDALPSPVDTLPLLADLTGATDRLRNAEANLQATRIAYTDRVASATANASAPASPQPDGAAPVAETMEARRELTLRIARARSAPLVENFRAVGDADFLRNDVAVRALLDSLIEVNRDREAYAALGAPDARYAAMTTRLTTLGQRLLLLAEQRLGSGASRPSSSATAVDSGAARGAGALRSRIDTTTMSQGVPFAGDSSADKAARDALDSAKVKLQSAELAIKSARALNDSIVRARESAEADAPARVPLLAMLVAALVLGLAFGYGVAFYREVKHPRIADAAEVERVTDTRVIVHTGPTRSSVSLRHRRQDDDIVAPTVDTASESYQLLHVTLTGFGDTAREVRVVSNDGVLSATVGLNLAVAAARDSRTTLLVDATAPQLIVARMLNGKNRNTTPSPEKGQSLRSQVRRSRVGRDLYVDSVPLPLQPEAQDELNELAREHDFTVFVEGESPASLHAQAVLDSDVVLCVRVGVTSLDWITAKVASLREQGLRLRAVLLWSAKAPAIV